MELVRKLSPISAFKPLIIQINDLDIVVKLDIFKNSLEMSDSKPHLSMSSESLNFIFNNTFGFDTLTVNGCFEEIKKSGFSRSARTLAIENLNNMGLEFRPKIILNFEFIKMFISRLYLVTKKINMRSNN